MTIEVFSQRLSASLGLSGVCLLVTAFVCWISIGDGEPEPNTPTIVSPRRSWLTSSPGSKNAGTALSIGRIGRRPEMASPGHEDTGEFTLCASVGPCEET